jgi:hypothetical protein
VNSDDLTKRQLETLKAQTRWMLRYLARLQRRMIKRKFLESDPLLQRVRAAHNAVHALSVELHYLSVESGAGRPARSARRREDQPQPNGNERRGD